LTLSSQKIQKHVQQYYRALFERGRVAPAHLPIRSGKRLAAELGYPSFLLDHIPEQYWQLFAPCGNPLPYLTLQPGDWILNLGCGIGIDSLAVALEHAESVHIVGIDIINNVIQNANQLMYYINSHRSSLHWICGDGECLPFRRQCFDAILMNGVFNLFPEKSGLLRGLHRVLKPGGVLLIADLCRVGPLPDYFDSEWDAWAWCMNGARSAEELLTEFSAAGFERVKIHTEENGEMFNRMVLSCRRSPA
jgi:arsenite methyltransferase